MLQAQEFRLGMNGNYAPFVRDEAGELVQVSAAALPGSQCAYLSAPEREVILVGNRGGGKTRLVLQDFLSGVGRGWGSQYAGILFRHSMPQLGYVETMSNEMIRPIWPTTASYNQLKSKWTWNTGETLEFRHYANLDSWPDLVGRAWAFIAFEQLENWMSLECYLRVFSCLRATASADMPRKIRSTANSLGPNCNNIASRFRLSGIPQGICGPAIVDSVGVDGKIEFPRRAIYSDFQENVLLRRTEPGYMETIQVSCGGDPARLASWSKGDWSVVSGGMFDKIFMENDKTIFIPTFEVPPTWQMFMSYDHGSSAPYSVGFWAESNGESIRMPDGSTRQTVRGDLFRMAELYGNDPRAPNNDTGLKASIPDIVKRIQEFKIAKRWRWQDVGSGKWKDRIKKGVADSSIFSEMNEFSIATEFEKPVTINGVQHPGLTFDPADKGQGSRKQGYALFRERLVATAFPREAMGLFVVQAACPDFCRTIRTLQRDERDPDELAKGSPDHVIDEVRYALRYDRAPSVRFDRRVVA
jgi:hypothetical protein